MTGRPTAEIVANLRRFIDYYGCDPGVPMSAVDEASEAADRLAELQRWKDEALAVDGWWSNAWDRVQPCGKIGDKIPIAMADEIIRLRAENARLRANMYPG